MNNKNQRKERIETKDKTKEIRFSGLLNKFWNYEFRTKKRVVNIDWTFSQIINYFIFFSENICKNRIKFYNSNTKIKL